MTAKPRTTQIYFDKPTVTDRLYTARGPSGWVETFERRRLDPELKKFLGEAPVEDAVDAFLMQRALSEDKRPTTWATVTGFLGRLLDISPLHIPPEIGLAFWGRVELALRSRDAN